MKRRFIYIWALSAALLVGYVALTAHAATAPGQACARCHEPATTELSKSVHAEIACYDCHAGAGGGVAYAATRLPGMYVASLVATGPAGPVTETLASRCLACHQGVLKGVTEGARGIRIDHEACAAGSSCDTCHSTVAHGDAVRWRRLPVMESCTACHRREKASLECGSCHVGDISEEYRLRTGPWQVTHGPQWKSAHGMGDLDSCSTCHAEDYCTRCHKVQVPHSGSFGGQHGKAAISDRSSCMTCHKTDNFCDSCHGIRMPHPSGFLREHSKQAREVDNPMCQRCHSVTDCQACHSRHVHPGNAKNLLPPVPGGGDER